MTWTLSRVEHCTMAVKVKVSSRPGNQEGFPPRHSRPLLSDHSSRLESGMRKRVGETPSGAQEVGGMVVEDREAQEPRMLAEQQKKRCVCGLEGSCVVSTAQRDLWHPPGLRPHAVPILASRYSSPAVNGTGFTLQQSPDTAQC